MLAGTVAVRFFARCTLAAGFSALPLALGAQGRGQGGPPVDYSVPADLRALLAPRRSEMRLVSVRYAADRTLLNTNYAGAAVGGRGFGAGAAGRGGTDSTGAVADSGATGRGGRGGGGGGRGGRGGGRGGADSTIAVPISVARIARLKRFDLSWQSALDRIETAKLSTAAQTELDSLKLVVARNYAQLDSESVALSNASPLVPFSPTIVDLVESRIRVEPVDGEKSAALITKVTRDAANLRAQFAAGLYAADGPGLRASPEQALAAVSALQTLRSNLNMWFIFWDGYDPLFSWWMRMPYRKADSTLNAYAAFLRDSVAPANERSTLNATRTRIDPAPAPKYNEVPDLRELIALPQDEMADIVTRFRGPAGRGGGGNRGGGGGAGDAGGRGAAGDSAAAGNGVRVTGTPPRDAAFYNGWLAALNTLDFDKLTRNAQVDYLFVRKRAEIELSRLGDPLPPGVTNPRKADDTGIPGPARGRKGLMRDLQDELIPYTPEQLMALAEREFAWCEAEMKKASRQMGFGDDWKAALEKTKTMHPPPGGQPAMIHDLVMEAIDYLRVHDLVTVPQVDVESQHMIMMTPERQLVNPFFLGGAQMSVSFPTDAMDFGAREQSMRGNSRPWSHATAFHEAVPGHNLVQYYGQRFTGYRPSLGGGPFFGEGWPVYWEITMYDMGFHDTPEEKVGALLWRMHRCARIIFSLKFHLGEWSPQEAIDFLVARVGHERDNATAEVRRSFDPAAGYGPLYQAAYLLGALQLRGLRKELVDSKQMPQKAFHDEILRQGSMPIALLRLVMTKQPLRRDMEIEWKFYGELPNQ